MNSLPIPDFFQETSVGELWKVPYEERASQALAWRQTHNLLPAESDSVKTWLLLIDVQNTFCLPGFELYVGGRSGTGAVDDNRRLAQFIYRHLGQISKISATMDTHRAMQIFHAMFLVDSAGNHPAPYSLIYPADLAQKRWFFNPALAAELGVSPTQGQEILVYYAQQLAQRGKYALTIWPYHAMLGGVGHALAPAIEEAIFFHGIARQTQAEFELKGEYAFTENYSAIGPEITQGPRGESLGARNPKFITQLQQVDRLIVTGQAKSHCLAWTVADLLEDIQAIDPTLAQKVYLLEDCTSPVVAPGMDFTDETEALYARFAETGINIVRAEESNLWF